MANQLIITVGRTFGSGGREIGERLGELLGFKVYDKELLSLAAEKNGVDAEYLRRVDEKATNSLLYTLAVGSSVYGARQFGIDVPINDQLFNTQAEIIREAAEKESCVFVGRCADYVLRDVPGLVRVFIYADNGARVERVMRRHEIGKKEAEDLIAKTDKRRASYYGFYTGRKWGKFENYDLAVNSSLLGIEGTARAIAAFVSARAEKNPGENEKGT